MAIIIIDEIMVFARYIFKTLLLGPAPIITLFIGPAPNVMPSFRHIYQMFYNSLAQPVTRYIARH